VLACGRVVVAPRVRAGNDASLPLEGVAAGADRRPQQVREPPRTVSSWSVDAMVIVPSLLGVVVALVEELACPVTMEGGSEGHAVWSARRGTWCA
jgi:hypothetical protein